MADRYESSGLLSLAALREHEKNRVREQAEAARLRAEAEQRARSESEREATRRAEERQRAERAFADSTRLAQLQRLEAVARAEAERSSALSRSAEELGRHLNVEREQRRTIELSLTARLLHQRWRTNLLSALCVGSWIAAFSLYFGAFRPAAERSLGAAQQALLTEQRARAVAEESALKGRARASELSSMNDALEQRLRAATADAEHRTLPEVAPHKPGGGGRSALIGAPQKPCRDDGDPLNPCLRR